MGNRAVVAFDSYGPDAIGVYLHWNGGRDSIEGLLEATKRIMAGRLGDESYARARFVQAATTLIPGNLSIGLGKCKDLDCDNYDNGLYVVDSATLEIKRREFFEGEEQLNYNRDEFADEIVKAIEASAEAITNG